MRNMKNESLVQAGCNGPQRRRLARRVGVLTSLALAAAIGGYTAAPTQAATTVDRTAVSRFLLVKEGGAILDSETGLLWEQSPSPSRVSWPNAQDRCKHLGAGGRQGWRVPTLHELASLMNLDTGSPTLPSGEPFHNVRAANYWASPTSSSFGDAGSAGEVFLHRGHVAGTNDADDHGHFVWCVRGDVDPILQSFGIS